MYICIYIYIYIDIYISLASYLYQAIAGQRVALLSHCKLHTRLRSRSHHQQGTPSITLMLLVHAQSHVCAEAGSGIAQRWRAQDGCSPCLMPSMQDLLRSRSKAGAPAGLGLHAQRCSAQLLMSGFWRLPAPRTGSQMRTWRFASKSCP